MPTAVSALTSYIKSRTPAERCDTCGVPLGPRHSHTFNPQSRQLRCACAPCVRHPSAEHQLVPEGAVPLRNFALTDAQWDSMAIPIGLAFFTHCTPAGRVLARYPGPAGAAESLLSLDVWAEIAAANPALDSMQPDVEALLVNRIGTTRDYYLAPIDQCYRLTGLIRTHWRGLGGGALVWGEIARFFADLPLRGEACPA